MPTNPYVNWWTDTNEQSLLHELMTEAIQFYGVDIIYLPRQMRREDTLYNEDVLSQFTSYYPMEVYLKNVAGWEGQGNFLSKFGLQIEHTVTVMLSVQRFSELLGQLTRPTEGDWVYLPAPIAKLFEIKFVENEKAQGQFYPLGTKTFYELQLELVTYSHEQIRTGDAVIDAFEQQKAYAQDLLVSNAAAGDYVVGETVFQGHDLSVAATSGVVAAWDANTSTVRITDIKGEFADGLPVVGATSSTARVLDEAPDVLTIPTDPTNDNRYLATSDDDFIDTREGDPFRGV